MTETSIKARITAVVAAVEMFDIHEFSVDFANPDGDEDHECLTWDESEWRAFTVDLLVAGYGDPDSGCPQSIEALRAFFGLCYACDSKACGLAHRETEPRVERACARHAEVAVPMRSLYAKAPVRVDLLNAAWRANPDNPQLEGNGLAMVNTISAMLDVVDAVSFDLVVGTLSDLGFVIQVGANASGIREIEDVLHEVLGLEQGDDGLWREPACDGPDEGDAESGPPRRIEPCCPIHFADAFGGKAGC